MNKGWKEFAIENIGNVIGGGTPSSLVDEYWGGDISWITPKDLSGYKFKRISKGNRNITDLGLLKSSAKLLPKDTILITSRAPIGYVAIADKVVSTNQGFKSIVLKDNFDSNFIYYLIRDNIPALEAVSSGSTFKEISGNSLKKIKFNLPPLPEQKAIAKILGDIDAKIELNRKMNETLEAMAQALFQSWFVDFDPVIDNALKAGHAIPEALQHKAEIRNAVLAKRHAKLDSASQPILPKDIQNLFPNTFVYNETLDKWIPEGWEVVKFDNVVVVKYGKDHKKLGEGVFPCYGSGGVMRYVNETICNKESVLIPRKGTLTNLMYVRKPFWSVDTMFFTSYKEANFVKYIFYFLQKFNFLEMNVGSAVPSMTTKVLNSLDLIKPTAKILECFEREVEMFLAKKESNTIQNESLIKQRDTLLPQLISGKLQVPESLVLQMDTELDKETKKII